MLEKWVIDIKKKMIENGIKQKDLADEMGISQQFVSYVFNGKTKCPDGFKKRAIDAIGSIKEARTSADM